MKKNEKRLLDLYNKNSEELNSFIEKHDFSIYTPNIGVFGENSTGKSTFLNAMLGNKEEFKMGFGETTEKITVLYKNKRPIIQNLSIIYKQRNYKHLDYMNIFDIPGFGQKFTDKELSKIIKKIDVVFWFINASKGIKEEDKRFLQEIKSLDIKIIIIFNKIDTIVESDEINKLSTSIDNEINKIKKLFQEENLLNNLIAVFPFSATKSLINSIKGKKGAFELIDNVLKNILLYTVFIESYRGFSKKILKNINIKLNKNIDTFSIGDLIQKTNKNLEKELKDNISLGSSLNPFSSKNEEAKPIVSKYQYNFKIELNKKLKQLFKTIEIEMNKISANINSFQSFTTTKSYHFTLININNISINIDLNSLAWDSFFGDSFAEEVSSKFKKKIIREVNYQIENILNTYKIEIKKFQDNLNEYSKIFAMQLDLKLSQLTLDIREPILLLLLETLKK